MPLRFRVNAPDTVHVSRPWGSFTLLCLDPVGLSQHPVAGDDGIRGIVHPIWTCIISRTCRADDEEPDAVLFAFRDVHGEVLVGQAIGNPPARKMCTDGNPIPEGDVFYRDWTKHAEKLWVWCWHGDHPFMIHMPNSGSSFVLVRTPVQQGVCTSQSSSIDRNVVKLHCMLW